MAFIKINRRLFVRATYVVAAATLFTHPLPASADLSDWQRAKRAADEAYSQNNYGVAERGYLEALKLAEKLGPADIHIAETLHSLVALYSTRSQFAKAEPLFERELRIREKARGPEHPEVVGTVGKLAQFYLNNGAPVKADRLANLLLGFSERKVKEQQAMKDNFTRLSKYYERSVDYAEPKALLKQLEQATKKVAATQDLELATTLDMLGHLYEDRKKPELSERLYKNALSLRQRALAPTHLALAHSYENLANLYTAQGKKEQAQTYYQQALDITEKTLQPGRPEFFSRLDSLARSHNTMGHGREAEALYKRALAVIDKTSPTSPDAGRAAFALACLYLKQGRPAEAEPLMKRALKVAESANGPEHAAVVPVLTSYADTLDKLNRTGDAARLRTRAKTIRGFSALPSAANLDF